MRGINPPRRALSPTETLRPALVKTSFSAESSFSAAPPAQKYTRVAVLLHWSIALLMLGNVALGLTAALLPDGTLSDENIRFVIDTHKSIGITVLGLAILRVLWRLTHRPPPLPAEFPMWERAAAHAAHLALYVLIFAMPLTGWLHDSAWVAAASHPMYLFGLFQWPRIGFIMNLDPATKNQLHEQFGALHTACSYALYGVLALHIAGALKHQWIDRHSVLRRMMP
ncbi:cytochrome b [Burkholderia sp. Ax-1719]|nr:cytochrome b [Burkholderia sp. Ax-1719]